jgi:hypothetical protein
MLFESSVEQLFDLPSGLDETLNEGHAEQIKAVIAKLSHVKTKGDIDSIIKMLRALVI